MLTLLQSDALEHSDAKGHTVAIVDALKESYSKKTIREPYPPGVNSNSTESSKNLSSPAVAGDGSDVGNVATEPHWQHSFQILFGRYQEVYKWYLFQGPQGIAVNPCDYAPQFKRVTTEDDRRSGLSLDKPPFVGAGKTWHVDIEGWSDKGDCRFEGQDGEMGHFVCGEPGREFLDFPVSKDAGYDEGTFACWQRGKGRSRHYYHRAWVLEY
jgi:hypothetical protein